MKSPDEEPSTEATDATDDLIRDAARTAGDRFDLWTRLLRDLDVRTMAEVGVYRGVFTERVLRDVPEVERYLMIDPWRHLDRWNKPANVPDPEFEAILDEARERTSFAAERREIHRGTTVEVAHEIPDGSLDLAYLDGDHTLRGITIDLHRIYPKVRDGGWIGGDDLEASIWQHGGWYEPTLVFPYVVHFAEAAGATVYALPHGQFLLRKHQDDAFSYVDLTGRYPRPELAPQLRLGPVLRAKARGAWRALKRGIEGLLGR